MNKKMIQLYTIRDIIQVQINITLENRNIEKDISC